jgi:hypothetical protein
VLCDAGTSAGEHQHHHPPSGHGVAHHDGAHNDPTCPYAQSAGAAPLPTLPVLTGAATAGQPVGAVAVTQTRLRFGPTRQQTPRGPPSRA